MEKTLRVLNRMVKDGVIGKYAIGGAVAAIFYIEPFMEHEVVDQERLADILARHGLIQKWKKLSRQNAK